MVTHAPSKLRNHPRISTILGAIGLSLALSAVSPAMAATFVVNSTADSIDANPGDGVCADSTGACTLRAAVMESNATVGPNTIDLTQINDPNTPIILTLQGADETYASDTGNTYVAVASHDAGIGDLNITNDTTLTGAGSGKTVIEWTPADQAAGTADRIFHIEAVDKNIVAAISGVTLLNGYTPPVVDIETVADGKIWQFKRHGGCLATGTSAATNLYDPSVTHGGGGGGGGGHGGGGGEGGGETGFAVDGVTLTDVIVANCISGADGGGIYNAAPLTVNDSVISGNTATSNGGGIYSSATLTVYRTTIGSMVSNSAFTVPNQAENGGGIFDTGLHTTTINESAINGNTATGGAALSSRSTTIDNLVNSTVSGNVARDTAGGISTNGRVTLTNVTVSGNSVVPTSDTESGAGAGLYSFGSGTFSYVNSIISNNTIVGASVNLSNCGRAGGGTTAGSLFTSTGHNLEDSDTCNLAATADLKNTDPQLQPLANNGGLTETLALPETSPAIDAGDNSVCPNNDQRGSIRPADGNLDGTFICDIGAFELFVHTADVHLDNIAAPNQVFATDPIEIAIQVHNDPSATTTATGVVIATDPLPTDFSLSAANVTTTGGTSSCSVAGGVVTCDVGDLAVGDIATVSIQGSSAVPGTLTITSHVTAVSPTDPMPANNSGSVQIQVIGNSDMDITAKAPATTPTAGNDAELSFAVTNNGPHTANNARMAVFLPDGFTYKSVSISQGSCSYSADDAALDCTIGSMASGTKITGTVTVTADVSGSGTTLFGVDADERDSNAVNDAASVPLTFNANSGGGCSYRPGSPFDPVLPVILLGGVLGLLIHSRLRRKMHV
ncbi:MAG: CSLREA domain-containing protein [Gammaproteobacteria bacterium]|nr:CSLREA domain-containing protein [Gammaproteobacteria bacterium]